MTRQITVAAIALTLSLVLTACPRPNSTSTPVVTTSAAAIATPQVSSYPPDTVASFMQGCTAGQPPSMEKNCSCMIQQIQTRYTYAQYQAMVQTGLTTAPGIQEIVGYCADNPSTVAVQPPFSLTNPTGNAETYVKAQDEAFLGIVSNDKVAQKSICNQVGVYGSQVSPTSIRNQVGLYGSQISDFSAYSPNAQKPPLVIQGGKPVMVLTKNRRIQGGTDPDVFFLNVCGR